MLLSEFPDLRQAYEDEVSWQEGDDTGSHTVFGDILTPYLVESIMQNNLDETAKIFGFIEKILDHEDEYATEVISFSVLESIVYLLTEKESLAKLLKKRSRRILEELLASDSFDQKMEIDLSQMSDPPSINSSRTEIIQTVKDSKNELKTKVCKTLTFPFRNIDHNTEWTFNIDGANCVVTLTINGRAISLGSALFNDILEKFGQSARDLVEKTPRPHEYNTLKYFEIIRLSSPQTKIEAIRLSEDTLKLRWVDEDGAEHWLATFSKQRFIEIAEELKKYSDSSSERASSERTPIPPEPIIREKRNYILAKCYGPSILTRATSEDKLQEYYDKQPDEFKKKYGDRYDEENKTSKID